MKKYLGVLFFIMVFNYYSQNNNNINNQIIYANEISNSGIKRLSDIFSLINRWDSYTLDGFRYYSNPNNLIKSQDWIVLLNGQKYSLDFLNLKQLNALPITVGQIDSIVIISTPQLYEGEYADGGIMAIYTKIPTTEFSANLRYATGNEIGDPGPWAYTQSEHVNVEELGPDHSASFSYKSENFYSILNLISQTHSATDRQITQRQKGVKWKNLGICLLTPSLTIYFNGLGGKHNLFVGYSTCEDQFFLPPAGSDLIFFEPVGREFPVMTSSFHLGLNGNINVSDKSQIKYKAKYSKNKIYETDDLMTTDFDWNNTKLFANLEYLKSYDFINFNIGGSFEQNSLNSKYLKKKENINICKLYCSVNTNLLKDFFINIDFMSTIIDKHLAIKSTFSSVYTIVRNISLHYSLSYFEKLLSEENNIWNWTIQGYDYLKSNSFFYLIYNLSYKQNQILTDVDLNIHLLENLKVNIGFNLGWFSNFYYESYLYKFNDSSFTFNSPARIFGGVGGNSGATKIEIIHKPFSNLEHKIFFQYRLFCKGDNSFIRELKTLPEYKLIYRINYEPVENFSLWTMITYTAATYWLNFKNVTFESNGIYKHRMENIFLWDIAAQKYFWERKIRVSLSLLNLLNQKYTLHPLGAYHDLSLHFQVELLLNSIL